MHKKYFLVKVIPMIYTAFDAQLKALYIKNRKKYFGLVYSLFQKKILYEKRGSLQQKKFQQLQVLKKNFSSF